MLLMVVVEELVGHGAWAGHTEGPPETLLVIVGQTGVVRDMVVVLDVVIGGVVTSGVVTSGVVVPGVVVSGVVVTGVVVIEGVVVVGNVSLGH